MLFTFDRLSLWTRFIDRATVDSHYRVEGTKTDQACGDEDASGNQQDYGEGTGDDMGKIKDGNQCGDSHPYESIGTTQVLFHTEVFLVCLRIMFIAQIYVPTIIIAVTLVTHSGL
jgi:hypothetical protein